MKKYAKLLNILTIVLAALLIFAVCSSASPADGSDGSVFSGNSDIAAKGPKASASDDSVRSAVNFDHELDSYEPHKDYYNFYFTYKTVHPWWDAVALGMEEAQRQYLDRGIAITYEYLAPEEASAQDQVERLYAAAQEDFDVIGVDVADILEVGIQKILKPKNKGINFMSPYEKKIMEEAKSNLKKENKQMMEMVQRRKDCLWRTNP